MGWLSENTNTFLTLPGLLNSNLPHQFWNDCIFTATHQINRIPTSIIGNKSPYEMLYQVTPSYYHLKVLGCLCYASTLKRNRVKFDSRATPCIFLGYPYGIKAYKLYNLQTYTTFTSRGRDVSFPETIFPYHHLAFLNSLSTSTISFHLDQPLFSAPFLSLILLPSTHF